MALDILVNEEPVEPVPDNKNMKLVSWVMEHVNEWEHYRDLNYEDAWKSYYQEWKSVYTESSKTRKSERSKFISPALGQAIEVSAAEMEEATFSRKNWIDFDDNIEDQSKEDMQPLRNQLIEDMALSKVSKAISEIYLNGAIYGTGIGKVVVDEVDEFVTNPGGIPENRTRIRVSLEPISPEDFVIDPSARNVNEGLGCAHIVIKSKSDIMRKQQDGTYFDEALGDYVDDTDVSAKGESKSPHAGNKTKIIEYHGLVPASYLLDETDEVLEMDDDVDLVEAIVTIANDNVLLKAAANPFLYRDRSIIAYQHDTVPNRFWGRGVAEKGLHSQRALNAELRGRQDGLALTIHPMMGIDATRIPRGMKLEIGPGKNIFTTGDPNQVLRPLHFGNMSDHTYREAGDLERMLQMGTGSMDSATPIGISPRNQTASGMSMIASGSIKRNKRTMRNVEEDFLKPLINKFTWRYQQFDPERYPYGDYKLVPYSTMGIMAREFEQAQIAQALQATQDIPQMKAILIKAFLDNSSINVGNELDAVFQQVLNPEPDPVQKLLQELQLQNAQLANEKLKREVGKIESETIENYANARSKATQAEVNKFVAIAQVEDNELDREAYGDNS